MTEYLSCADTAKLVRVALKEAFPGVKFSVRSHNYAGGASIDVGWMDGPTAEAADSVGSRFRRATFDSMTDCMNYHNNEFQGREVSFGADFVFCNRDVSVELTQRALDQIWKRHHVEEAQPELLAKPWGADFDSNLCIDGVFVPTLVYREQRTMSVGEYPGVSALADQVKNVTAREAVCQ